MTPADDDRPRAAVAALLAAHSTRNDAARIGVAVSGGGDSVALLLATLDWARGSGADICAATVDHGLRPGSAREAAKVALLCGRLGCGHDVLRAEGLAPGPNLQARARGARYDALEDWGVATGRDCILLGHTMDDVAETLILRLRRGAGIDGLARMAAWRSAAGASLHWGRPFLEIGRAALRLHLTARGVEWIEDPSNDDPAFDRVRIRRAIDALELDPRTLAASAAALDAARATLDRRAGVIARELIREDRGDLLVDHAAFVALTKTEPEHPRRLLVAALAWIGGGRAPRRAEQVRLADHIAAGRACTLAGCRIAFEGPLMRIGREMAAVAPAGPTLPPWDGRWRLDGPHAPDLAVGALGDDAVTIDWRAARLPLASVRASPAIRRGRALVAAPVAGWPEGWTAAPRVAFAQFAMRR